jgi:Lipid desaturase domain
MHKTIHSLQSKLLVQYLLIALYYAAALLALSLIQWSHFTWLTGVLTFYAALWSADFAIGLIHLYIDYSPLNFKQGFGLLYTFKGDRGGAEFNALKQKVMADSHWFDRRVYAFKIHHRNGLSNKNTPYRDVLFEFYTPAAIFVLSAIVIVMCWGDYAIASYLAFFDVIFSLFAIHAQYIHYSMHGSQQLKLGNHLVKWLSQANLIYSYQTHAIHHKDGHTGFCFIAGHANFAVNWICKKLLARGLIKADDWHGHAPKV